MGRKKTLTVEERAAAPRLYWQRWYQKNRGDVEWRNSENKRTQAWRERVRLERPEQWAQVERNKRKYMRDRWDSEKESRLQRERAYGITELDWLEMFADQEGKCRICKRAGDIRHTNKHLDTNLCVDHCHTTGAVRGLLCVRCNMGIGQFRDDPSTLEEAARYLRASREPKT